MNDSVHFRNAQALNERNKQDRVRHEALFDQVQHLERQLAMLVAELSALRQQMTLVLVARGNGPTARE